MKSFYNNKKCVQNYGTRPLCRSKKTLHWILIKKAFALMAVQFHSYAEVTEMKINEPTQDNLFFSFSKLFFISSIFARKQNIHTNIHNPFLEAILPTILSLLLLLSINNFFPVDSFVFSSFSLLIAFILRSISLSQLIFLRNPTAIHSSSDTAYLTERVLDRSPASLYIRNFNRHFLHCIVIGG